ncbi:hypothetical protein JKA74_13290 [Marivirga sp. S37H4]|uniref:Uncharacterized protein n=1 Tax=Marivirga aurantiaca TaxID=2802615 RepID=A0A934X0A0_9BACT|nr:hypothetical protein [Marivirga aurantiaca]MBK6266011.1 hypothetical protein [Marivirga aurantiaca]
MASEQLEQWLEKYWQGELSHVEEMQFRSELKVNKDSLSGELKSIAEWFETTENVKQELSLDDDFDAEITSKIHGSKFLTNQWSWWKVAASVLIIISLGYLAWLMPQQQDQSTLTEINNTQENPEKAFEETKATLLLMANMMNSGKDHLNSLQLFQVAQEKVQNSLKKEESKKDNSEKSI